MISGSLISKSSTISGADCGDNEDFFVIDEDLNNGVFSHDMTPLPLKADVHHTDADSMSIKCCPEIPQSLDLGGEEGRDFQIEELVEGRAGRKFNNIMNHSCPKTVFIWTAFYPFALLKFGYDK